MAALMMLIGLVAFFAMPKDIFPAVDIPEINLVWYYPGMSAPEMEQRIVNITRAGGLADRQRHRPHRVDLLHRHRRNQNLYAGGFRAPALGISQLNSVTSAIRNILPQGIAPPTVLDFDATNVPIADLMATSQTLSETPAVRLHVQLRRAVPVHPARPAESRRRSAARRARSCSISVPIASTRKGLSPQDVLNTLRVVQRDPAGRHGQDRQL